MKNINLRKINLIAILRYYYILILIIWVAVFAYVFMFMNEQVYLTIIADPAELLAAQPGGKAENINLNKFETVIEKLDDKIKPRRINNYREIF